MSGETREGSGETREEVVGVRDKDTAAHETGEKGGAKCKGVKQGRSRMTR